MGSRLALPQRLIKSGIDSKIHGEGFCCEKLVLFSWLFRELRSKSGKLWCTTALLPGCFWFAAYRRAGSLRSGHDLWAPLRRSRASRFFPCILMVFSTCLYFRALFGRCTGAFSGIIDLWPPCRGLGTCFRFYLSFTGNG